MSSNTEVPEPLLPMKDEILKLDCHSPPEINSQLCIPDTTQKWLVSCADSINSLLSLMPVYLLYFRIGAIKSILAKGKKYKQLADPTLCHYTRCMSDLFQF